MGEKESEGHGEAYKSGRWRRTAGGVSGPTEEKRDQIIRKAGTAEGPEH